MSAWVGKMFDGSCSPGTLDEYLAHDLLEDSTGDEVNAMLDAMGDSNKTQFASIDTIHDSQRFLNHSLRSFGWGEELDFMSSEPKENVKVMNCVFDILQGSQNDKKRINDLTENLHKVESDHRALQNSNKKLTEQLATSEKECSRLCAKLRTQEKEFKAAKSQFQLERDAINKEKTNMQFRDSQFQHEIRKKERAYNTLQQRMTQLLREKNKEAKSNIDVLSALQRDGKRGTWGKAQQEAEDFTKKVVGAYQGQLEELRSENEALRDSLKDLRRELQEALNNAATPCHSPSLRPSQRTGGDVSTLECHSGHFDLPFDLARDSIEESIRAKMKILREKVEKVVEPNLVSEFVVPGKENDVSGTTKRLQQQLKECRAIIKEQDNLIQMSLNLRPNLSVSNVFGERDLKEEENDIELRRDEVRVEVSKMEQQRAQLESEIEQFNQEKALFNEERMKALMALDLGSPNSVEIDSTVMTPVTRRLLQGTPQSVLKSGRTPAPLKGINESYEGISPIRIDPNVTPLRPNPKEEDVM